MLKYNYVSNTKKRISCIANINFCINKDIYNYLRPLSLQKVGGSTKVHALSFKVQIGASGASVTNIKWMPLNVLTYIDGTSKYKIIYEIFMIDHILDLFINKEHHNDYNKYLSHIVEPLVASFFIL